MIFFSLYAEASGIFAAFATNTIFFAFHAPRGKALLFNIQVHAISLDSCQIKNHFTTRIYSEIE